MWPPTTSEVTTGGATPETVATEFELAEDAGISVRPECLEAVLDEIDRRGGIGAYLATVGVEATWITTLRAQLVEPR